MSNEVKVSELASCPFCKSPPCPRPEQDSLTRCGNPKCPVFKTAFTWAEWNTRAQPDEAMTISKDKQHPSFGSARGQISLDESPDDELSAALVEVERLRASRNAADNRIDLVFDFNYVQYGNEIVSLRASLAEKNEQLSNSVPRSRYDAVNADWLKAEQERKELATRSIAEIERLEASVKHLARSTSELLQRAEKAETALAEKEAEIKELHTCAICEQPATEHRCKKHR